MKETKITCDYCEQDLTSTGSYPMYRLRLAAERLPHDCSAIYDIYIIPPIENDNYFCGLGCLGKWLEKLEETRTKNKEQIEATTVFLDLSSGLTATTSDHALNFNTQEAADATN